MMKILATLLTAALFSASPAASAQEAGAQRGAYLVNAVMICGRCHTTPGPGSKPFAGGRMIETPAYKVQGSNITPDGATGIGGWSDAEIGRAITQGLRPDGSRMAPAMPYNFYANLTDTDLSDIVAYLRTLAPVTNPVAPPVYVVPVAPATPVALPALSGEVRRGAYLATLARCLACHSTPGTDGEPDLAVGLGRGGARFEGPWGVVVAPDITPRGLGAWSDDDLRRALVEGRTPEGRTLAAPMQSKAYAQLTAADLAALIAWMRTLPAGP